MNLTLNSASSFPLDSSVVRAPSLITVDPVSDLQNSSTLQEKEIPVRKFAYFFAALNHFVAAGLKSIKLNDGVQKRIDNFSLIFSKTVHSCAYAMLSLEAFKDNRVIDAFGKLLDPLMSNFSSIENINLTKGIAGGIGVLDYAQANKVDKSSGKLANLTSSFKAMKEMMKDIYTTNPLSSKRKILIDPRKEEGHSLAFAAHVIFVSSALGLTIKPLEKSMNVVRNLGAIIANTVTMFHPDDQKKLSGSLFNVYGALDSVQKFLPKAYSDLLNNLNMGIYNIATFYYGDLSHKRTKNVFTHYS